MSAPTFGTLSSPHDPVPAPVAATPFRLVVLGDFSGRTNRGRQGDSSDIAARKLHKIDRGNFEEVMDRLGVALTLTVEDETVELSFQQLDDFHPDQLVSKVDRFNDLDTDYQKSGLLRNLLHNAELQALESAWRGLDWMLRRALKGGQGEAYLFDLTLEELTADLTASEDLTQTGVYQNLIEKGVHGPKGQPWTLFVGNYLFQPTAAHADVLGRMARIARETSAPFLAGLPLSMLVKSYDKDAAANAAWTALRQLPEAGLLGLALPRFLMRLPYGENTMSIDSFSFEEFPTGKKKRYLWANAALACASLLGQGFQKDGWSFRPGNVLDLTDMPLHAYMEDDEEQATLAEAWLNRQMVEQMGKYGFMCLLCVKGRNQMQLFRFQSLAQPAADQPFADLLGSWGQEGVGKLPPSKPGVSVQVGMGIGNPAMKAPPPAPPPAAAKPGASRTETALEEPDAPEAPEAPEAPAEPEMDPELAALMAGLESPTPETPAAEPDMDPELAALMAELEGGAPVSPPADSAESGDPELDALMKDLMGDDEK